MAGLSVLSNNVNYAANLAQYLLGTNGDAIGVFVGPAQATSDGVPLFDDNGNPQIDLQQVIKNARPVYADVVPRSRIMDHPVENGQIISDYKVTLPLEIIMNFIVEQANYRDTYQEINDLWQNSTLVSVQTNVGVFYNMVVAELPHEERPEMFTAISMHVRFRQILISGQPSTNYSPLDPQNNNTSILGFKIPSAYTIAGTGLGALTSVQALTARIR